MFFTYPSIYHNIRWAKCQFSFFWVSQEVHWCLFLYRNSYTSKNIKEHIFDQVMLIFEACKLPTMSCMLPKSHKSESYSKYHLKHCQNPSPYRILYCLSIYDLAKSIIGPLKRQRHMRLPLMLNNTNLTPQTWWVKKQVSIVGPQRTDLPKPSLYFFTWVIFISLKISQIQMGPKSFLV
jgi:hypothetical protein